MSDGTNKQPYDPDAMQKLFAMQPDNRLTPAQMVRRSLFPRWEIIKPAPFDPVAEEDHIIQEILEDHVQNAEHDDNLSH